MRRDYCWGFIPQWIDAARRIRRIDAARRIGAVETAPQSMEALRAGRPTPTSRVYPTSMT